MGCGSNNASSDCNGAVIRGTTCRDASDQPSGANEEVKIDNFSFGPETIKVSVGTTVTWINRDDIPHTVVRDAWAEIILQT